MVLGLDAGGVEGAAEGAARVLARDEATVPGREVRNPVELRRND